MINFLIYLKNILVFIWSDFKLKKKYIQTFKERVLKLKEEEIFVVFLMSLIKRLLVI